MLTRPLAFSIFALSVILPAFAPAAESRMLEPLKTLDAHYSSIELIAFSPDGGRLVTQSDDRMAVVWRTADWSIHCQIRDRQLQKPQINAEASVLAAAARTGRRTKIIFWDLATCKRHHEIELPERIFMPEIHALEKDRLLLDDRQNLLVYSIPENRVLSRLLGIRPDHRANLYLRGDSVIVRRTTRVERWSAASGRMEKQVDLDGDVNASTLATRELALLFESGRVEFRDPSSLAILRVHQIEKSSYGASISIASDGRRFAATAGIHLFGFDGVPHNLGIAFGASGIQLNQAGTLIATGSYDGLIQIVPMKRPEGSGPAK